MTTMKMPITRLIATSQRMAPSAAPAVGQASGRHRPPDSREQREPHMQEDGKHGEEQHDHRIPVERHVEGQAGGRAIAPDQRDHRRAADEHRQRRDGDDPEEATQGRLHQPHPCRASSTSCTAGRKHINVKNMPPTQAMTASRWMAFSEA